MDGDNEAPKPTFNQYGELVDIVEDKPIPKAAQFNEYGELIGEEPQPERPPQTDNQPTPTKEISKTVPFKPTRGGFDK